MLFNARFNLNKSINNEYCYCSIHCSYNSRRYCHCSHLSLIRSSIRNIIFMKIKHPIYHIIICFRNLSIMLLYAYILLYLCISYCIIVCGNIFKVTRIAYMSYNRNHYPFKQLLSNILQK